MDIEKKKDLAAEVPRTSENDIQISYGKPFAIYQLKAFIIPVFEYERQPWLEALNFVHNSLFQDYLHYAQLFNGLEKNKEFRSLHEVKPVIEPLTVFTFGVLTSDTYFTGNVLNDYFAFFTSLITNGTATYCATAQEDNASLEVFTRLHKYGLVDYDRVVVMRTAKISRPLASMTNKTVKFFTKTDEGDIQHSLNNLANAGYHIVNDIINNWNSVYESNKKYASKNYIDDIYATLDGTPVSAKRISKLHKLSRLYPLYFLKP